MTVPATITPRFYNTLTHQFEDFVPIEPGKVRMYNCGPTVYDFAHIGNFKSFLFADVLRRFLELLGHDVHQVMNLTDVGHMTDDAVADGGGEDKMAAAAKRLQESKKSGDAHATAIADPSNPYQVAEFYIDAFLEDAKKLGLKVADEYPQNMPRATAHVKHMLELIGTLIDKAHAYVASDGAVYFRVQSFPEYGKLSGNTLDQLRGGAGGRVDAGHQATKEHPADFLLWKPDPSHLMRWDPGKLALANATAAALGEGYPGWHVECSAMAKAVLQREVIDIHTGGEDNIFPHHECEIAQSCCSTGETHFARFWMHSRHLMVEGEKMSKSKGNFFTVRQILDGDFTGRAVDPAVLRFELIKANYRSRMDFSRKGLLDSASAVKKLREFAASVGYEAALRAPQALTGLHGLPAVDRFIECLADDLNIAGALGVVFEFVADPPEDASAARQTLAAFDHLLGVLGPVGERNAPDADDAAAKCAALDEARRNKDFAAADAIRNELQAAGYEVKTTKDGTVATKKLA
ncbi:MAG: cysteine--tRNA ligase [Planctomycetota bacterium]